MPNILVTDPAGGQTVAWIPDEQYQADPSGYQLADDTILATESAGGEQVTGTYSPEEFAALATGAASATVGEATSDQQLAQLGETARAEQYGGAGGALKGLGLGGLSGASFGITDALRTMGSTELEREVMRAEREENAPWYTAGQLAGEIVPAALTGGAGFAARAASLTPAGMLARQTARIVAMGADGGRSARLGAAALGAGIEGAASAAGNYLAEQVIQEDPKLTAEAFLARAGLGALLGGAAGGVARVAGDAVDTLAARLANDGDRFGSLLDHLVGKRGASAADDLAGAGGAKGTVRYRDLIPAADRDPRKVAEYLGGALTAVDDAAARRTAMAKEVRGILNDKALDALPVEQARALRAELSAGLDQHAQAVSAARSWAKSTSKGITPEQLRAGKLPPMSDDTAEEGIAALAGLDDATAQLEQTMARVRAATGRPDPAAIEPTAKPSPWAGFGQRAADAAAALETVQSLGVPGVPDVDKIPVIGPALSAYLKFRAARQAIAGRLGGFPGTARAQAAAGVVSMRDRAADVASRVAQGAARRATAPRIAVTAGAAAGASIGAIVDAAGKSAAEVAQIDPAQARAAALARAAGLPPEMREAIAGEAERVARYLAERAPRPPFGSSPWQPKGWRPSLTQALEWSELRWAAESPEDALEDVASGESLPVAARTLRELYPALWQAQQAEIEQRIEEIARNVPRAKRLRIGQAFDLALDASQMPGYGQAPPLGLRPPEQVVGDLGRPSVSSPVATLAETPAQQRAAR